MHEVSGMSTIFSDALPTEVGAGSGQFGRQITKESVSQQAYVAIRNSLMRSRLKPGQKLVARQVAPGAEAHASSVSGAAHVF